MDDTYRTLASELSVTLRVDRSEFIASGFVITTELRAKEQIRRVQQIHSNATHNCYAYRIGTDQAMIEYFSDAGEPSGTAGRPILLRVKHAGLTNCLVVVTRYYGGRKLGVPGLIRAYSHVTDRLVEASQTTLRFPATPLTLRTTYSDTQKVLRILKEEDGTVIEVKYEGVVELSVALRSSRLEETVDRLSPFCSMEPIREDALTTPESTDTDG